MVALIKLVEHYEKDVTRVKELIRKAMELREESYNRVSGYEKTCLEVAQEVTSDELWVDVISNLLHYYWNETHNWVNNRFPKKEYPDGYYILEHKQSNGEPCLVYLYDHPDFNGKRHIAFGAQDGGDIMPVNELIEDAILLPVKIIPNETPTTTEELESIANNYISQEE